MTRVIGEFAVQFSKSSARFPPAAPRPSGYREHLESMELDELRGQLADDDHDIELLSPVPATEKVAECVPGILVAEHPRVDVLGKVIELSELGLDPFGSARGSPPRCPARIRSASAHASAAPGTTPRRRQRPRRPSPQAAPRRGLVGSAWSLPSPQKAMRNASWPVLGRCICRILIRRAELRRRDDGAVAARDFHG